MMTNENSTYGAGGRLGMNPVGMIVLLVLLVYALACLVLATASDLRDFDRSALIAFVVLFPVLILVMFVRPITRRASTPSSDSAEPVDETAFLAVMSPLLNAQLERAGNEASVVQAEEAAAAVFAARRRLDSRPGVRRRVLWVDDSPDANVFERQAFERVGIQIDHSPNATGPQGNVQREEYGAVIISERGDTEAAREGYALLDSMRSGGDHTTPLFVYTDSNGEDHRLEAMNRGAQDATSRPVALFDMVTRSLV
jgi:CheY-like chemotaxis protein